MDWCYIMKTEVLSVVALFLLMWISFVTVPDDEVVELRNAVKSRLASL